MTLFWFKWLFANLGSTFVVNLAINALAPLIEKVVLHTVARTLISDIFIFLYRSWNGGIIGALIVGSVIGTAQWLVLRTKIPISNRFILATSLGWFVAGFFQNFYFFDATGGFIIGLAQWLILRRFFSQAGWWVLVNTLAWGLSAYLSIQASLRLNPYAISFDVLVNPGVLVFSGCMGIIAVFTGLLLVWLLIYKKREPEVRD
jgi:hypothetical protein